ncbi:hypothetical protein BBBOND_0100200 [Babesia bigemina]|uniref:Uncharacterized protein n=1 Tax=Babesia bigemina TaxID=5866 RepID=A0A061CYF7_BABBI|nr:hypothetical protein BBBOND_0100200 [Babesia bigemina]CDR93691.1 hypothetical protein BBBOND_0100200 [Babesia bigemina]|eukprot:XP_012765877.1 hypothetical protein BBBOND_0100200 [Babesia bigemina]
MGGGQCSGLRLRGLGAAGEDVDVYLWYWMSNGLLVHKASPWTYKCSDSICGKRCKGKEYACQCTCCKDKQRRGLAHPPPPPPPPPGPSSGVESVIIGQPQTSALSTEPNPVDISDAGDSTPFSPSPQVIAAVIVAIIVAIILLDLCIFRFPVGRNIRDFLVRKIPFCIAFYS